MALYDDANVEVPEDWLRLTPTMKLKRKVVAQKYAREIESMYEGKESAAA